MSRPWVKLYTVMLGDPKMILLSDAAYRRFVEVLLYAAEVDDGGRVAPTNYIAIKCHQSPEAITDDLTELAQAGILHYEAGEWYVTNWGKRQPAETVYDRVKRYREKKAEECNVTETLQKRNSNVVEIELKRELELKEEEEEENPPKPPKGGVIPPELDTVAFREVWERWHQYRREIRKPLKPTTVKGQLKKLAGWGESKAIQALENSITNTWTGIFEPDANKTNGTAPAKQPRYVPDADGRF